MSDSKPSWFTIIGSTALGVGFIANGVSQLAERRRLDNPGGVGQVAGRLLARRLSGRREPRLLLDGHEEDDGGLGRAHSETHDVGDINERVALIVKLIRKGAVDPELQHRALRLLSRKCDEYGRPIPRGQEEAHRGTVKWCYPEKDCMAEVRALYDAVKDPRSKFAIRYVRDTVIGDVFTAAKRTLLVNNGGDCDDFCVTLGALLMAIGHPVTVRVIRTKDKLTWNHVYLTTPKQFDEPEPVVALDPTVDKPMGWEAPGASECKRTGKPAGIVAKVRDFPVTKRGEG